MADGFKTMVKMMTDEMSVIDKSRRNANTTKMASTDFTTGYQMFKKGGTVKKAAGGAMGAMEDSAKMRMAVKGMAKKQKPMGGRPIPAGNPPAGGLGMAAATPPVASSIPAMKKGGKAEGGKADMAQDKAMIKKAMKQHDAQEHKGGKGTDLKLRKGGKAAYATGGVVNGQAGFKDGGDVKKRFATGGEVKSGAPVAMPQGKKKPSSSVRINQLSGTF
jgi:hypothetical protein